MHSRTFRVYLDDVQVVFKPKKHFGAFSETVHFGEEHSKVTLMHDS